MDALFATADKGCFYADFYTGDIKNNIPPLAEKLREISISHPYPGDLKEEGGLWVIGMASSLARLYDPHLMMMFIAQPLLLGLNLPSDAQDRKYINCLFNALHSFMKEYNYIPIIIGMGGLTPLISLVDTGDLEGNVASSLWAYHHAGVYRAGSSDYEKLQKNSMIKHIISREEFASRYGITDQSYLAQFPDYHITAADNYAFDGIGGYERTLYRIPIQERYLPVYSGLTSPQNIVNIKKIVNDGLDSGKKIALILIEGVGSDDFPLPYSLCENYCDWYTYDQSINQYLAITTGHPFYANSFPPICDHQALRKKNEAQGSPYKTAFFADFPLDALGRRADIRSVAVGSRSVTTYACSGADISIECLCRNLATAGICSVFNTSKINAYR